MLVSPHGVFCPGCNAWHDAATAPDVCPRCGMKFVRSASVDSHQPTYLWHDDDGGDTEIPDGPDHSADGHRLLQLVGGDLHVYRIDSLLGRGGMGWVFLAQHRDLERPCALKILAPTLAAKDPDYVARFENEGRAAASLVHPNIVTTHAIGAFDDLYFLEMEFLRGRSLQQRLKDGPLAPIEATSIAAGVAAGLAVAHREGIVHRDLKPDTVRERWGESTAP
jgi:serine/threonine protein kinase